MSLGLFARYGLTRAASDPPPPPEFAFLGFTKATYTGFASGSAELDKPTGVLEGDLLLGLGCLNRQRQEATGPVMDWPDFTEILNASDGTTSSIRPAVTAFYKVAGPSEPATYTVQHEVGASTELVAYVLHFRGQHGTPIDDSAWAVLGGNNTTLTVPEVTATRAGILVHVLSDYRTLSNLTFTVDSVDETAYQAGSNVTGGFAVETIASAGATGSREMVSDANVRKAGALILVGGPE